MLFSTKNINVVALRYFHVYGSRQEDDPFLGGVVAVFKRQIKEGSPLTLHGNGNQKRVFTHVDDIVTANMEAYKLAHVVNGSVYNCASSVQTSIIDLAGRLIRKSKKAVTIDYKDPLPGDIYSFNIDNSKIMEDLGVSFAPFHL